MVLLQNLQHFAKFRNLPLHPNFLSLRRINSVQSHRRHLCGCATGLFLIFFRRFFLRIHATSLFPPDFLQFWKNYVFENILETEGAFDRLLFRGGSECGLLLGEESIGFVRISVLVFKREGVIFFGGVPVVIVGRGEKPGAIGDEESDENKGKQPEGVFLYVFNDTAVSSDVFDGGGMTCSVGEWCCVAVFFHFRDGWWFLEKKGNYVFQNIVQIKMIGN